MSLILDALKKLEKDRMTRRKRSGHIASDILLTGEPEARRKTRILISGLAGIAVAALVLTLVFLNPFSAPTPAPDQAKIPAAAAPSVPPPPPKVLPVAGEAAKSIPAPTAVVTKEKARPSREPVASSDETPAGPVTVSRQKKVARKSPAKAAVSDAVPLPTLTVSGIVWAENRGTRRAMVNGEIVGEGGNIRGTKVAEILPDHVRFSHNGRTFSIYMK